MSENGKYNNFQECCEQQARSGSNIAAASARKYLVKGKNALKLAIEDEQKVVSRLIERGDLTEAERRRAIIQRAEETGILDGSFELTYEGANRLYNKIQQVVDIAGKKSNVDYKEVLQPFESDPNIFSTAAICLIPELREQFRNNEDILYKIVLTAGSKRGAGYFLPTREKTTATKSTIIPTEVQKFISSLPTPQTDEEKEIQRKMKILLDKKVERETFHFFRDDPRGTIRSLEKRISETENTNLRDAYQRLFDTYDVYLNLETRNVNQDFIDPRTGKKGVLPSLHQRSALCHIMKGNKLGVFDGCGTGKTAIGILAQPLIEQELGRKPKVLIVCPNPGKKAWKKGLIGDKEQRYLTDVQKIAVINGERKDENTVKKIRNADWVVVNYEQLITVNGGERFLVDELNDMRFDYVIFDESHHIKSQREKTKQGRPTISTAAQQLARNAMYVASLTASPIADTLDDYGVQAHILQPEVFITPKTLIEKTGKNPREVYTFFNEKTVRRKAEDINEELDWEEKEEQIQLTPVQEKVYRHIEEHRPNPFLQQARKALLDPRLVDPEILKRAGVLEEVGLGSSAKYAKLEELLTSENGPMARGEKFIVFTNYMVGVTKPENENLKKRYGEIGRPELYEKLKLNITLDKIIETSIKEKFGKNLKVRVINGIIGNIEEREEIVDRLSKESDLAGLICTTDSGGESLNFSAASYVVFMDEDYSPKTAEQALSRLLRKGQDKKVTIVHLRAAETLDEEIKNYVEEKRVIAKIAMDCHSLTDREIEFFNDTDGKKLIERVKKRVGGISIDTYKAIVSSVDDFETKKRNIGKKRARTILTPSDYETTEAQKVSQLIGQNPVNCWFNQDFVERYIQTLPNLATPVLHLARVADLVKRAKREEIEFPRKVLAEASGSSILWDAYQELQTVIKNEGYEIPKVTDRDFSELMLAKGKNPVQILGNMNGQDSEIQDKTFDMVDNGSLILLPNEKEIKRTLLESHRILKDEGLLELILKNAKFSDSFYSAVEGLGFELISEKGEGFSVSKDYFRRLKETHGEHFAESYESKLANSYMLLARKVDKPAEVKANDFKFDQIESEESEQTAIDPRESKSIIVVRSRRKSNAPNNKGKGRQYRFNPSRKHTVDRFGIVGKVEKLNNDGGE